MALEQEIKLVVIGDGELDITTLPLIGYQQGEINSTHLISVYFDTPDFKLMQLGLGLRLRFDGQHWLQTVKEAGQVTNGLHQRQEWEHELAGKAFDLSLLRQTPLQSVIDDKALWPTVSPIFTTDFTRQYCLITATDTAIELAYDRGRVYSTEREAPIHELELELKSGDVSALTALAQSLSAAEPLQANDCSKAKLGYGLLSD